MPYTSLGQTSFLVIMVIQGSVIPFVFYVPLHNMTYLPLGQVQTQPILLRQQQLSTNDPNFSRLPPGFTRPMSKKPYQSLADPQISIPESVLTLTLYQTICQYIPCGITNYQIIHMESCGNDKTSLPVCIATLSLSPSTQ